MFCTNCGAEITDNAAVCPICGTAVVGKAIVTSGNVPNHLIAAIVTTIFCCQPAGILSIVYAVQVNSKLARGDVAGAMSASRVAYKWIIASIILGFVGGLLSFLCYFISACIESM